MSDDTSNSPNINWRRVFLVRGLHSGWLGRCVICFCHNLGFLLDILLTVFEIANYYICWTPMEFRALTFSLFLTLTAAGLSLFPYFWYWQQLAHRLLLQKKRKRENFIPWAKKTDRKSLCEQPHSSHRQLSYCVHVGLLTCNTPPLAWESDEELEYLGHPWTLRTKVVGIKYYDSSPTSDTKNLENWLSHFNTLSHISFSKSQSSK